MGYVSFREGSRMGNPVPIFCEGGLKIHPKPYFNQDLSSNDRDFKQYEMLGCRTPCSNDHKYYHDNSACDARYLFPSTTAYYVTTQTILSKPGSFAMFRRCVGDIQNQLIQEFKTQLRVLLPISPS